mmetsp:Transcript_2698/g.9696  ORF Transcript_2698/g.9696 Transcript_2698/m.9696 type:complete len:102 (-) Transcript_2698:823-1128(-)
MNSVSSVETGRSAPAPLSFDKNTRACIDCKLIKTFDQFVNEGCDNCQHLELQNERERVSEFTTSGYSGMVSVFDGSKSWVQKWLRLRKLTPGCYALELNSS